MKEKVQGEPRFLATFAAYGALLTGIIFFILLLLLHGIEPEFDPSWRFISEYMLGQYGWMMHLSFFSLAASQFLCLLSIIRKLRVWYGYIGIVISVISGVGITIAAVFTTDPITVGYQSQSLSGSMHVFGASLDYTPVATVLLSLSLLRDVAWKKIQVRLIAAAVFSILCMVAFILLLPQNGIFGPGVLAGLVGRILVLSYVIWTSIVALHVISTSRRALVSKEEYPVPLSPQI